MLYYTVLQSTLPHAVHNRVQSQLLPARNAAATSPTGISTYCPTHVQELLPPAPAYSNRALDSAKHSARQSLQHKAAVATRALNGSTAAYQTLCQATPAQQAASPTAEHLARAITYCYQQLLQAAAIRRPNKPIITTLCQHPHAINRPPTPHTRTLC
jgi:hypothetical protein